MSEVSKLYNARDWYWLAEDGRLYSSTRQSLVPVQDDDYVAWTADGSRPTAWPRDRAGAGAQTNAALQAVLSRYGLFASLADYAEDARYRAETGGITVNGLALKTDDRAKTMLLGSRIAAQADPSFQTTWYAADGGEHSLNAAAIIDVSNAVLAHVAICFRVYGEVLAGLAATPPTIAAKADVDAAFAIITN